MDRVKADEQSLAQLSCLLAVCVFVFALVPYLLTVAPTVCFWDCGEYTATAHTLEVPHPPGNPLYLMIGRLVSMVLFFVKDPGLRLNLLSAVSSAISAALIALIIVRAFTGFMGVLNTNWKRTAVFIAGFVGGLFAAYGSTVWFSSVEAEVNAPLLVPVTLCTWLALVWAQSTSEKRDRLLVLITYIAFLGIGIHMYSMITLGPLFIYVILVDREKRRDWRFWATSILMGIVMYDIAWFLWAGAGILIVSLFMSCLGEKRRARWLFCFFLVTAGLAGFSTHLYLPIRSSLNPLIDENHPATFRAFTGYLQRKQYGSESMASRMFWRRGSWEHQFGIEAHIGFGGFFLTQFYRFSPLDTQKTFGPGKLAVYMVLPALMIFGMLFLYRRNRNSAILLGTLFFSTTVAMVLYMNFSDGTRSEKRDFLQWEAAGRQGPQPLVHREVRVRDYFYLPGFALSGMWVGIAAGGILILLGGSRRRFLRCAIAVLFAASPALPLAQNYGFQSRHGDYVPFDYAWNILMSCEKNGIIFTNGDNDTFPLWALQETYGIRRDVRIVNLSLLNTKWYIRQLATIEPKVPMTQSLEQIEKLEHVLNPVVSATRYQLRKAGIAVDLPVRSRLRAMRIQDQMVISIVDANAWKKPLYMAITVGSNSYMGLGPYMQMQGMVYRIMPRLVDERERIDVSRSLFLLDQVYRFTGLGDGTARINVTSEKLVSNYAAAFMQVAIALRASGDSAGLAIRTLDRCISLMPWDWRPQSLRRDILATLQSGSADEQ